MSKKESFWFIEPRDALVVRDGRPFGQNAGNRADSLEFPFPSTITGAARTRAGLSLIGGDLMKFKDHKINGRSLADVIRDKIEVSGPLLAKFENDAEGKFKLLVPAPADAAFFEVKDGNGKTDEDHAKIIPLMPLEKGNYFSNSNEKGEEFRLLGLSENVKEKRFKKAPKFWYWETLAEWLKEARTNERCELKKIGIGGLSKDRRTHVEMDYAQKTGREGGLFETRGLEFLGKIMPQKAGEKLEFARYGFFLRVKTEEFAGEIAEGIAPLGGERRLVSWKKTENLFPDIDREMKEKIMESGACRLILLSPAIFRKGFYPSFDDENIEIEAAAVNRYQVISGWDFQIHKPKPTRRLCPAGSVFFLKFKDKTKIETWLEKTWFRCISDEEQDRKDGFGLAVIGYRDGNYLNLEDVLAK